MFCSEVSHLLFGGFVKEGGSGGEVLLQFRVGLFLTTVTAAGGTAPSLFKSRSSVGTIAHLSNLRHLLTTTSCTTGPDLLLKLTNSHQKFQTSKFTPAENTNSTLTTNFYNK